MSQGGVPSTGDFGRQDIHHRVPHVCGGKVGPELAFSKRPHQKKIILIPEARFANQLDANIGSWTELKEVRHC